MSGIYHEWNGTVLTVTSDSGTSSADLKGDDGCRGAQGAPGIAVGGAPDGYGLGKKASEMRILYRRADLDELKEAGWYSYYGETVSATGAKVTETACGYTGTTYGGVLVIPAMYGYTQFFFCRIYYEAYLKRHYDSSTSSWSAWEWVNPPMLLKNEYRTTERYAGKPVYVKRISYTPAAAIAASTTNYIEIPHSIENFGSVISCNARRGNYLFPVILSTKSMDVEFVNDTNIRVRLINYALTTSDNLQFDIYYVKNT